MNFEQRKKELKEEFYKLWLNGSPDWVKGANVAILWDWIEKKFLEYPSQSLSDYKKELGEEVDTFPVFTKKIWTNIDGYNGPNPRIEEWIPKDLVTSLLQKDKETEK